MRIIFLLITFSFVLDGNSVHVYTGVHNLQDPDVHLSGPDSLEGARVEAILWHYRGAVRHCAQPNTYYPHGMHIRAPCPQAYSLGYSTQSILL